MRVFSLIGALLMLAGLVAAPFVQIRRADAIDRMRAATPGSEEALREEQLVKQYDSVFPAMDMVNAVVGSTPKGGGDGMMPNESPLVTEGAKEAREGEGGSTEGSRDEILKDNEDIQKLEMRIQATVTRRSIPLSAIPDSGWQTLHVEKRFLVTAQQRTIGDQADGSMRATA